MKQGTTTTFKVKQFDLPDITEIIFSFTNDKNNVVVERTTPTTDDGQIHKSYPSEVSLEDGYYKIGLDQDETLKLEETFYVEAQIMFSGAVTKAYIDKVRMPHTFYTKVIDGASTNGEEIELAMELSDVIEINGGGSSNYNDLTNKPRINNIELIGNKTDTDLGLATKTELNAKQNTITGGNGIDVSSDVVSVDLTNENSFLAFMTLPSDTGMYVDRLRLGRDDLLRRTLINTNYQNPLASKTYVDNLISGRLKRLVVESLPTQDIDTNTIYMVLKSVPSTNNIYDEYMYINNAWELIGSTEVDLSNYYTKSESDNRYQDKLTVGNGIDITSSTISAKIVSSGNILKFSGGELIVRGSDIVDDVQFKSALPYDTTIRQRLLSTYGDYNFQPKLTAGTNITIDSNNVISASGGGSYTFTDGLTESSGTVGIDLASGSKLLIDANDKLDVDLSSKQDTIDSTHKLSADLIADGSTNKPSNWNAKSKIFDAVMVSGNISNDPTDYPNIQLGDIAINRTTNKIWLQRNTPTSSVVSWFELEYSKAKVTKSENNPSTSGVGNVGDIWIKGSQVWVLTNRVGGSSPYTLTWTELSQDLSAYQPLIDSNNKLDADLVDDSTSTNQFVTSTEKSTWNGKADNITISTDTTSTTVSLTLADNHEYRYTQDLTSLTLTMPSGDFISSIVFASGSTPTSMTYDSSIKWSGDDVTNGQFVPSADKDYDICLYYNGLNVNGIVRGV